MKWFYRRSEVDRGKVNESKYTLDYSANNKYCRGPGVVCQIVFEVKFEFDLIIVIEEGESIS